jgi:conjugal transfer mating pair stabilization protein TraG
LFTLVLLAAATPGHASLGVLPQCVPPSQDRPTTTAEAKSPLPELPRVTASTDPEDRDFLIRTIAFEAGEEPDEGKAAVAHVVLNRERSGRWGETIREVVTRPWQFEPWMTRRKQMAALSPSDPRYRDAARIADAVLSGEIPDPTAGATHFLNPTIVRKRRGGSLPEWARGEGQPIGQHTFYAPNGGVPTVEQTSLTTESLDVSPSCSGQEVEKTPDAGLMTFADRG